jgi:hypothetical protein
MSGEQKKPSIESFMPQKIKQTYASVTPVNICAQIVSSKGREEMSIKGFMPMKGSRTFEP